MWHISPPFSLKCYTACKETIHRMRHISPPSHAAHFATISPEILQCVQGNNTSQCRLPQLVLQLPAAGGAASGRPSAAQGMNPSGWHMFTSWHATCAPPEHTSVGHTVVPLACFCSARMACTTMCASHWMQKQARAQCMLPASVLLPIVAHGRAASLPAPSQHATTHLLW